MLSPAVRVRLKAGGKVVELRAVDGGGGASSGAGGNGGGGGQTPIVVPETIEPHDLARLAGRDLYIALAKLERHLLSDEITPGQLAQTVKPVHAIWAEMAGGTTATRIELLFEDDDG